MSSEHDDEQPINDIETWIANLECIPVSAIDNPPRAKSMDAWIRSKPDRISPIRQALLWLTIGEIEIPHQFVQTDSSNIGSYIHGIVHRMEGDFENANYWFRHVVDQELLTHVHRKVYDHLVAIGKTAEASQIRILIDGKYAPKQLVTACRQSPTTSRNLLEQVAYAEWLGLWNFIG